MALSGRVSRLEPLARRVLLAESCEMLGSYVRSCYKVVDQSGRKYNLVPRVALYVLAHAAAQTIAQDEFTWPDYLAANPGLDAHFRDDYDGARRHWRDHGFFEERPLFPSGTRPDSFLLTAVSLEPILADVRRLSAKDVLTVAYDDVNLMTRVLHKKALHCLVRPQDFERLVAAAPFTIDVDEAFYRRENPHVARAIEHGKLRSARQHFIHEGWARGRLPFQLVYNMRAYREHNLDLDELTDRALREHFEEHAVREGRLNFFGTAKGFVTWGDNPIGEMRDHRAHAFATGDRVAAGGL